MSDRERNARKPRAVTVTKVDLLEELEDEAFLDNSQTLPPISAAVGVPLKKSAPETTPDQGMAKSPTPSPMLAKPKAAAARPASPVIPLSASAPISAPRALPKPGPAPKLTTSKLAPIAIPPPEEEVTPPLPKRAPPPSALDGSVSPRSPRPNTKSVSFSASHAPASPSASSPAAVPPISALRFPSPVRGSAAEPLPAVSVAIRSPSPVRSPLASPRPLSPARSPRPASPSRGATKPASAPTIASLRPVSPSRVPASNELVAEAAPMLTGAEAAAKKEEERLARTFGAGKSAAKAALKPMAILGAPRPPAVVPPKKGSVLGTPVPPTTVPVRAPPGSLSADELVICRQKFKAVDKDNSGRVEQEELVHCLEEAFGPRMDKGLVKRLAMMQFLAADKDKSGSIDQDEFLQVYAFLKTEADKMKKEFPAPPTVDVAKQQQEEVERQQRLADEQRKKDQAAKREEEEEEEERKEEEAAVEVAAKAQRDAEAEALAAAAAAQAQEEEQRKKDEEEKKRKKKEEEDKKKKAELERRRREEDELEELAMEDQKEKAKKEEQKRKEEEEKEKKRKAEEERKKKKEEDEKRKKTEDDERKKKQIEEEEKRREDERLKQKEEEEKRRQQREDEERRRKEEEDKRRKGDEDARRKRQMEIEDEKRRQAEEEEAEREDEKIAAAAAAQTALDMLEGEARWSMGGAAARGGTGGEDVDDSDFLDDLDSLATELRSEREERSVSHIQRDVARVSRPPDIKKTNGHSNDNVGEHADDDDDADFDEKLQERYMVEHTVGAMEGELQDLLTQGDALPDDMREQLSNTLKRLNNFKAGEKEDEPLSFLAQQAGVLNNVRKSVRLMPTPVAPPGSKVVTSLEQIDEYQKPLPLPPPKGRSAKSAATAQILLAQHNEDDDDDVKRELPALPPEDVAPPPPLAVLAEDVAVELELAPDRPTDHSAPAATPSSSLPSTAPVDVPHSPEPALPAVAAVLASLMPTPVPAPVAAAPAAVDVLQTAEINKGSLRPQPVGMLPQPSGAPNGIMWGFLGKKEGAGGIRALISRKDTWEIRWVVIDDRSGSIIYGIINRKKHFEKKGEVDIRDATIQEVSESLMNRPGVFRVRPKGTKQQDHFFCHMYDPKQSEVWVQAMVYCGATLSRETAFSSAEAPLPETRAASKTRGATAAPNSIALASNNAPGAKSGKIEKLSGSLFSGWKAFWAVAEDRKLSIYDLGKNDQPDHKSKVSLDLPSCQISELLQGAFKGRRYCLRLLENRKKEVFLAAETGEILRDWLRVMIAEGAIANVGGGK